MEFPNRIYKLLLCTALSLLSLDISNAQGNRKHFSGDNTDETEFNKIAKTAQRSTRDLEDLPRLASLKLFTPIPKDQGKHGTCVAWSSGYAARTISYCIQHQLTDKDKIQTIAFSPDYLYYFIKSPGDNDCSEGAKIETALKVLADTGDMLISTNIPECMLTLNAATISNAKKYSIKAYSSLTNVFGRISKNEVIAIKKSIAEQKPVIFSLKYFASLDSIGNDGIWKPNANENYSTNHAVCIVGYDDAKSGGAFEVMNSWGTSWGNNGFFWVTYDQMMQYGSYALELMDKEVYDPNATRGFSPPQLKGSLDFVLINDFGNDIAPMNVVLTNIDGHGLVADNNHAVFSDYRLNKDYGGGTKFKIKFTTNAPAFVYIFSVDDNKTVSTLFPYADNVSPAVNSTNATIYLPSEEKHYSLNADASRDRICIMYSKSAIDFNILKNKISNAPTTIYETILALYKDRIIPLKNVNFNNDQINFGSNASEQQLVCFFIDMNHK